MMTIPTAWETKKPTLFSLTADLIQLDELLTESGGELTPEVEAALTLLDAQLEEKTDHVAWYLRTCEARIMGYRAAEIELAGKRTTEQNKIDRLKQYVRACMDARGTRKLEGQVYTFAIQQNGGKPPVRLLVEDPQAFPDEAVRIVRSVDKEKVRELLAAGQLSDLAVVDLVGSHLRLR